MIEIEVSSQYGRSRKANERGKYKIKRIVYSTYQAVSGAGKAGIEDLENGINGIAPKKFP